MNYVSDVAKTFFHGVWKLMLHTDFPGVGVSFAAVIIGFFIIRFSIRIFGYLTGFHGLSSSDYGHAADAIDKARNYNRWKHE